MTHLWRPRLPTVYPVLLGLLALTSPALQAQTPSDALAASSPASSAQTAALNLPAPLQTGPLALPADIAQAREIWRQANERVAEFPRGHRDLLRWEAANLPGPSPEGEASPARALGLDEALRLSLRHRPELYTRAGMNALEQAQVRRAFAVHVRELQHAWIDAVALRQSTRHLGAILEATRTGSELSRRMARAGNASQAALMREQLLEAEAWTAAANAEARARAGVERLARLLGQWDTRAVDALAQRLPASLPALPAQVVAGSGAVTTDIEAAVLRSHPALDMERIAAERAFSGLSAERWQAWRDAVDIALQGMPPLGADAMRPPHLDDLSLLRDHALERATQQQARLLELAAQRRSMAREAWAQLQTRHALAQHSERVVVNLQTALEQESLLRYNGMLESSWQLLGSARERLGALEAAARARRDFWRAQADWQALLAGADYSGADFSTSGIGASGTTRGGH
ncbi:MAG: hypothetical protein ACK4F6_03515 [Hylemonella sp.]